MHRRQTLQWCARRGLNALHRRHNRIPFFWSPSSALLLSFSPPPPSVAAAAAAAAAASISSGEGTGLASGGTAPGFVTMALKCAKHAKPAMMVKAARWKCPAAVSCRIPSSSLLLIQGGIIIKHTVYTAYRCNPYVIRAHVKPQQSTFNQCSSKGPVPNLRRRTVAFTTTAAAVFSLLGGSTMGVSKESDSGALGCFRRCAVVVLIGSQ